jgi:hypothetical protein
MASRTVQIIRQFAGMDIVGMALPGFCGEEKKRT